MKFLYNTEVHAIALWWKTNGLLSLLKESVTEASLHTVMVCNLFYCLLLY